MHGMLVVILLVGCARPMQCPIDTAIVVDTASHRMALCEGGVVAAQLSVAIGGGGVDKQHEGDRKTPRGSYPLGPPRSSAKFNTFVPVGYPTPAQRSAGRTGGDIGIHGPSRKRAWLGRLRNWVDWTDGCIAVATDDAIDKVARWIARAKPKRVQID
jgi:murein L,D-transpeptidase YafK